jgi:hypothetical protein
MYIPWDTIQTLFTSGLLATGLLKREYSSGNLPSLRSS